MQCTSYIPVYYHARDLKNLGARGFSWHLFDSQTNYGEERGYNVSLSPSDMNQCLSYDKAVLRQMIQNHEATFRYQVEELHRLYRRQRELMGEMRAQDLVSQTSESCNSLSHTRSDISQTTSHARGWLLGYNIQQTSNFVAIKSQEHTTLPPVPFVRENSYNEVKFLPSSSKGDGKRSDFELHITQPTSDSGDLSGFNLNSRKRPCLIDLNEPIQSDPYVSVDGSSNDINSSAAFDLNCLPVSCFSEPESTTLDNLRTIDEETTAVLDCTSAYDQATSKGKRIEDNPVLHKTTIDDDKFLKTETDIDLNNEVVTDEPSPLKSAGNADLVGGPVSPENKERSPPRGKSEGVLLSEQGEGQLSSLAPDTIAAQILIWISSSAVQQNAEPLLMSSGNLLCWFAEIVCSSEDDLKKERGISSCSGMGPTSRRTRQRKDVRTEFVPSKNLHSIETAPLKRNRGKRARAKVIKHTKLCSSPEDVVRKLMSSTSKRFSTRSELAVVRDWGTIRKRQEGYRRRASKFAVHSS